MEINDTTGDSEFDMSFSTLGRISAFLLQCNISQSSNDISAWLNSVMVIYKEAETWFSNEEKEEHKEYRKKVEVAYKQYLDYVNMYTNTPNSQRKMSQYQPPRAAYDSILEWEMKLRHVLDRKKLLLKKGRSARDAMV